MIDLADSRLAKAKEFGADVTINNGREDAVKIVYELTAGLGVDVAIEAVGVPDTFELAAELIRPGGTLANVGVHGKPATHHLEKLWIRDVTVKTGLVDTRTIPQLLSLIAAVTPASRVGDGGPPKLNSPRVMPHSAEPSDSRQREGSSPETQSTTGRRLSQS